jgi:hypothetical protein
MRDKRRRSLTAQAIAMTLHELATNAANYGALSAGNGRVEVEWSRTAEGQITLRWAEIGGPCVQPPTRKGFGTQLMERMIRAQLKGEISFIWRPQGPHVKSSFHALVTERTTWGSPDAWRPSDSFFASAAPRQSSSNATWLLLLQTLRRSARSRTFPTPSRDFPGENRTPFSQNVDHVSLTLTASGSSRRHRRLAYAGIVTTCLFAILRLQPWRS